MFFAKIKHRLSLSKIAALMSLILLVIVSYASPLASLSAQTPAVTQGYGADSVLERGLIVRLSEKDTTKVEALTLGSIDHMHGIVVDANDAPVTLSSEGKKVFVATIGRYEVLVSDQNGPINSGDYITISSLNGVGMKADQDQSVVAGKANDSFNGNDGVISQAQVKKASGGSSPVNLARIQVDIGITRNPLQRTIERGVPEFLRKASTAVADKPVSAIRIYISVAILLVSTIITGSLLYGGVRSGIVAIGRNPLSKKTISRSLLQVVLTSFIVFIIGLFAVYLLLKL